jgi:SAM-dependent methyltransferase
MNRAAQPLLDERQVERFASRLYELCTGGLLALMIDLGHRTGLFEAAAGGPATSQQLADRAGLQERYVREWLGALTTGGIFAYDPAGRRYTLPPAHAACLTGSTSMSLAPISQLNTHLGKHLHQVASAFRHGGGVPYSEFRPEFTEIMDGLNRGLFDELLLDGILTAAAGLTGRLRDGIGVADLGCGTGHAVNLMAGAYPASSFVGYDLASDAIERARAEAEEVGLANTRFEVADVARLPTSPGFDLICAFDAIHDQVDPAAVLRWAHDALRPGGILLILDLKASTRLEDNIGNPLAPWIYSVSTLHCLTVSLAHGGPGLGAAWGEQLARQLLADAGFMEVEVRDVPKDPLGCIYVCRPAAANPADDDAGPGRTG